MTLGRIVAAAVMGASALLAAPTAGADQADPGQKQWVFESEARPDDVWDQTNWDWDPIFPIIPHKYHGEDNQKWYMAEDGSLRNVRYGWCATEVDGKLAGRECDRSASQKWKGHSYNDYHSWQFELVGTDLCTTHNGVHKELILTKCERDRVDQQWVIREA